MDPADMREAARIIAAFYEHDGGGDAARYPVELNGSPTLTGLSEVNLRQLREDLHLAYIAVTQIEGIIDYEVEMNQAAYDSLPDEY